MKEKLTPMELEVMCLLAEGMDCYGICDCLDIEYCEYKKLKNSVLKKLGIKKITQILATAINIGLLNF